MKNVTKLGLKNKIAEIEFPKDISIIDDIMDGYKNYQILSIALKMSLFDEIDNLGPSSPYNIADAAFINEIFIRSILIALENMGFLKSDEDMYYLTEPAITFLCKKSPYYQGDLILSLNTTADWNNLTNMVKRKKPPNLSPREQNEYKIRSLSQQCIRGEVQNVIQGITSYPGFSDDRYLLDIGGSHGLYSVALCQENNTLFSTIIEQEDFMPITSSLVHEYGMEDRITVQKGNVKNLLKGTCEEGYDIVLISHLLYKYSKNIADILENVAQLINSGGIMVLNHLFCSPQYEIKSSDGLREFDHVLSSFGNPLYHPEKIREVLEELGFVDICLIPYETVLGYSILCIGTHK